MIKSIIKPTNESETILYRLDSHLKYTEIEVIHLSKLVYASIIIIDH